MVSMADKDLIKTGMSRSFYSRTPSLIAMAQVWFTVENQLWVAADVAAK